MAINFRPFGPLLVATEIARSIHHGDTENTEISWPRELRISRAIIGRQTA
jgi:hypothetical protein